MQKIKINFCDGSWRFLDFDSVDVTNGLMTFKIAGGVVMVAPINSILYYEPKLEARREGNDLFSRRITKQALRAE